MTECMYTAQIKLKKLLGGSSPGVNTRGHERNSGGPLFYFILNYFIEYSTKSTIKSLNTI